MSEKTGLTPTEAREFSVARLMRAMIDETYAERHAGFELEACRATAAKFNVDKAGFFLPPEIASRALTATGGVASGGALVQTSVSSEWYAHALTNGSKVIQLGATVVQSSDSVAIPRVKPGNAPSAVVENAAPTQNDLTLELPVWAPKTMTNNITVSRRLLVITGSLAEMVVRNDLAEAIAVLVDQQAIAGSGAAGQTTGILNTAGLANSAIGVNGGAPTYANLIDVERQTSIKKAVTGSKMGWLGNSKVRATMRGIVKTSGFDFLWQDPTPQSPDGTVLGYNAAVSDNVPSNLVKGSGTLLSALIFGNWADLYIVQFSPVGILADPYSLSSTGAVRFNVFQDVDTAPRRIDSFCAITDMAAA